MSTLKRLRWALIVSWFGIGTPGALAQDLTFPEGSVDPTTEQFTVPVADEAQADELCKAIQSNPEPYPGEDTVIFEIPNDTNSDDVTCHRLVDDEGNPVADGGDDDELDPAVIVAAVGGLVLLGAAWVAARDGSRTTKKKKVPQTPQTPAGWYPDPHQAGSQRYWDGSAWTEHRHSAGQ